MPPPKSRWYTINKHLIPVKGIYFFFTAAIGTLLPYITIYMKQLGMSSTETGIIYGVMPFINFFLRPLFGALADKTKRHKMILITCTLLTGILYCLLLLVPKRPSDRAAAITTLVASTYLGSYVTNCGFHENVSLHDAALSPCEHRLIDLEKYFVHEVENHSNDFDRVTCEFVCEPYRAIYDLCFESEENTLSACMKILNMTKDSMFTFNADLWSLYHNKDVRQTNLRVLPCDHLSLINVSYGGRNYRQFVSKEDETFSCTVNCPALSKLSNCEGHNFDKTFTIFFAIFLACNIFFSPIFSIVDAIAYDMLGENRQYWGFQRCWATAGFATFAIGSAVAMHFYSKNDLSTDYTPSFLIFLGLTVLSSTVTYLLKFSKSIHCPSMMKNILPLLKDFRILVFLVVVTMFGIMDAVIEAFLFWYLETMGGTPILFGLCLVANCVGEIVMLLFAGTIIKTIGRVACLQLGFATYAARFVYYSFIKNPWLVLIAETTHCVCFGLMYAGASSYASLIAPDGMSATVQGLVGGLYFGFAKGIGSLVTGKLVDPDTGLGFVWTFRFYAFLAAGLLIVYSLINHFCFREKTETHPANKTLALKEDNPEVATGETLLGEKHSRDVNV